MKIFIFEYITSGGTVEEELSVSLLSEGSAMLYSILNEFKSTDYEVFTLIDYRLKNYEYFFDWIKFDYINSRDELEEKFRECIESCDYYLIIAPETGDILYNFTKIAERYPAINLGCNSGAIKVAGDKFLTFRTLNFYEEYLPRTELIDLGKLDIEGIKSICNDLGYPLIFKPIDGVSCEGISVISNSDEVEGGIKKVRRFSNKKQFIVQEFIKGENISFSIMKSGKKISLISINAQLITLGGPSEDSKYIGGYTPYINPHIKSKRIHEIIQNIAELIPGLNGYFGIDLIINKDNLYILEINPRLTTSFVGIQKLLKSRIYTQYIQKSKIELEFKKNIVAYFTKIQFRSEENDQSIQVLQNKLKESLVTPLYRFNNIISGFLVLSSSSLEENLIKMENINKFIYTRY